MTLTIYRPKLNGKPKKYTLNVHTGLNDDDARELIQVYHALGYRYSCMDIGEDTAPTS